MLKIWNAFLKLCTPIVKFIGKIHVPFSRSKITGVQYYKYRDKIQPGDVLLSKTDGELSNIINPEDLKHAALYVGSIDATPVRYVIEATGHGVKYTDLVTFLTTKSRVVGSRPKFLDGRGSEVGYFAKDFLGIKYDYTFELGAARLYCFELLFEIYSAMGLASEIETTEVVRDKPTYGCHAFYDNDNFITLFDTEE